MGMIRNVLLAVVGAQMLGLGPTALAAAPARSRDACIIRREINGFSAPNDHTVYVRVGVSDIFRLDLMGDCPNLTFRQSLGLEDRPATGWICSPLEATVIYRDTGITQRCPVTALHKLTPDEVKALPRRDRP